MHPISRKAIPSLNPVSIGKEYIGISVLAESYQNQVQNEFTQCISDQTENKTENISIYSNGCCREDNTGGYY